MMCTKCSQGHWAACCRSEPESKKGGREGGREGGRGRDEIASGDTETDAFQ